MDMATPRERTTDKVREHFIEQMGLVTQAEGLPRIAGRLMGLMVFDGKEYSFSELSDELRVSRGSVSHNTRLLEDRGVIERVARPGDRQDYFRLADNPCEALLDHLERKTTRALETITKTIDSLPPEQSGARTRLGKVEEYYRAMGDLARAVEMRCFR